MLNSIKAIFLTIVLFFLNIPYGIDAPTRAFIEAASLDTAPAICEQTPDGGETTFTLTMQQAYRAIRPNYDFFEFKVGVFDDLEGIDPSISGERYGEFQVLSPYGDDSPDLFDTSFWVEIVNAPDIIKVGDYFTLVVHLKLSPDIPAGTYHVTVSPNYAQECIYPNALIVK